MWRTFVREYLRFSPKERRGIVMLVLAMLLTGYFPDLFFYFQRSPVADNEDLKAAVLAFEAQLPAAPVNVPPALFYFDPNTLSSAGWQQLGVSERTAGSIGKYLAKGGRFRVAADLEKVYSLPPALCTRLMPYVRIADGFSGRSYSRDRFGEANPRGAFARGERRSEEGNSFSSGRRRYYNKEGSAGYPRERRDTAFKERAGRQTHYPGDTAFTHYRKKYPPVPVDINEADSSVWQSLPGIGPGFARRIIAFRDRLGGFYSVEQVGECYGLPDSVFQKIQPFLQIGSSSLKKLDLNSADEKSLAAHPYIRYKLARLIVQYRSAHAGFRQVADLRSLPLVDEIIYRKIEHYIEIKH